MLKVPCFWCDTVLWKKQLTNDHVVPRGVGGPNKKENIVRACDPCNNERGRVVSIYLGLKQLSRRKDIGRWKTIIKSFAKLDDWLQLQKKWETIENSKLGYSPTANMKLKVIDGRTKKVAVVSDSIKEYNDPVIAPNGFQFTVVNLDGKKYTWNCSLSEAKKRAKFLKTKHNLTLADYSI